MAYEQIATVTGDGPTAARSVGRAAAGGFIPFGPPVLFDGAFEGAQINLELAVDDAQTWFVHQTVGSPGLVNLPANLPSGSVYRLQTSGSGAPAPNVAVFGP